MTDDDRQRTLVEAVFGVEIAWWEFVESCKATPEGRRLLAILRWLARHPRTLRFVNWIGRRMP